MLPLTVRTMWSFCVTISRFDVIGCVTMTVTFMPLSSDAMVLPSAVRIMFPLPVATSWRMAPLATTNVTR